MSKLFASVSSLWVLFLPLLTVSKVGILDSIDGCCEDSDISEHEILMLIKRLGDLRDSNLITEEEFQSKKKKLLEYI